MNKKLKTAILVMVVLALSVSMMAFRPFGGDSDEDGIPDQTETLAEVLGIDVETLQAAYETAQEAALEQALADGKITQEQLDAMAEKEGHAGMRGGPRGMNDSEFLADALGITVEELQAAQQEAQQIMIEQALEDGEITQEEYDNFQLQQNMAPYFEQARQDAFQNAVDQALADGVITAEQAEAILNGEMSFGHRPGGFDMGGPGGHGHGERGPKPESSETE